LGLGTPLLCSRFKVWALAMIERKLREKAQQLVNLEPKDFNNNKIKIDNKLHNLETTN
jgi:hypothetical protein